MKTIELEMPEGQVILGGKTYTFEGGVKEFKQIKNSYDSRLKALEFDSETARLHAVQKADREAVKDQELESNLLAIEHEAQWAKRAIEKAAMLIETKGLTEAEIALIQSPADGVFWRHQDNDLIANFRM